jgi:hypothetical protein
MEDALLARLSRAELHARMLGAAVLIVAAVFIWFLTTAAVKPMMRTHKLSIVDTSGHERIAMSVNNLGPYIHVLDGNGKVRISLYLQQSTQAGRIDLRKATGTTVARIYQSASSPGGGIQFNDDNGTERAEMGISTEGYPSVWLFPAKGKPVVNMFAGQYGPSLRMQDSDGTQRVYAGAYVSGSYGMEIDNASGSALWKQP